MIIKNTQHKLSFIRHMLLLILPVKLGEYMMRQIHWYGIKWPFCKLLILINVILELYY